MAEDTRKQLEMQAALRQIKNLQQRKVQKSGRRWRLDVPLTTLAFQGLAVFAIGILVGLGFFVLFRILVG